MRYRIAGDGWSEEFEARRVPAGREWEIVDPGGIRQRVEVERLEEGVYRMSHGGGTQTLTLLPGNVAGRPLRFLLDDTYVEIAVQDEYDLLEELLGRSGSATGSEPVEAVMPGIIRKVLVGAGDLVELDQALIILEAMKMENEVRAPLAGRVARILVAEGRTVGAGDALAIIEATARVP